MKLFYIVKTSWNNPSKIVFINGGFKKGFYDFANNRYIYEEIESTDEVIGNIYDNTELLKE